MKRHLIFAETEQVCFFWIVFFGTSRTSALRQAVEYRKSELFESTIRHYAKRLNCDSYQVHSMRFEAAVARATMIEERLRLD